DEVQRGKLAQLANLDIAGGAPACKVRGDIREGGASGGQSFAVQQLDIFAELSRLYRMAGTLQVERRQ
ncbi:MAG: hypothetical protein M3O34_20525, partial [Chloroflexota bacterium]|nr:hypothetical protein [Chloroflexota bacterium]